MEIGEILANIRHRRGPRADAKKLAAKDVFDC